MHARHHNRQRIPRDAQSQRIVARLEIRIKLHLEADLLSTRRLLAHVDFVHLDPVLEVLRLVVLVDGEQRVAVDDRQVRVPCLRVEGHGEGEEGRPVRGPQLPDWLVGVRVEASALVRRDGRVFDPESEAAVCAHGGDEVGV